MVAESKSGGTMMPLPVTGATSSVSSLSHSLVPRLRWRFDEGAIGEAGDGDCVEAGGGAGKRID
jgi:hypothetical protein